jgi:DNA-binding PadR family transcriptional regulator
MLGKQINLTPTEALFVMALNNAGSLSGAEIVQKIGEDLGEEWLPSAGSTYKIVQSLESKGFIEETTDEENRSDQRIRTYSLTPEGMDMLPKVGTRFRKLILFASECCPDSCDGIIIVDKRKKNDT